MTKAKSAPAIPVKWSQYIKRSARSYAYGVFSPEDAEQTACEAFIRAKARYIPSKGPFEHYATSAIRNALLNARKAEQRNGKIPANPDDRGGEDIPTPPWAAEGEVLRAIDKANRDRAVSSWTDSLSPKLSSLYCGHYSKDMSQREIAVAAGVSQACISQRNGKLIALGREALAGLVK